MVDDAFRPFKDMMTGDPGQRPIDLLLKSLGAIASDLKRSALSPSEAAQSNNDLQSQVGALRTLAASLPSPLSSMMQKAASDFDNEGVSTAIELLSRSLGDLTASCRAVVDNSYPFLRGSRRELGLVDFGRMFGPNGLLDQYFNQKLAKYANTSGREWVWKSGDPVGRSLSPATLQSFQRAARIREAFFSEGSSQPFFMVTITPPALKDPNVRTTLNFYGTNLVTGANESVPTGAPWPGSGSYQIKISISTTPPPPAAPALPSLDLSAKAAPAPPPPVAGVPETNTLIDKSGVWALFHLLDDASKNGNRVTFYGAGQTLSYTFGVTSVANPLDLAFLRQFHCPANI